MSGRGIVPAEKSGEYSRLLNRFYFPNYYFYQDQAVDFLPALHFVRSVAEFYCLYTMPLQHQIVKAQTSLHYEQARGLIKTYAASRNFDAALAKIFNELDHLESYYPVLLLACFDNRPAGCVAFQELEEGICEMKRLFVLPDLRGLGIGAQLAARLIQEARDLGYRSMRLDSHPSMLKAQELYSRFGFRKIDRYNQNPIPGILFFELQLSKDV